MSNPLDQLMNATLTRFNQQPLSRQEIQKIPVRQEIKKKRIDYDDILANMGMHVDANGILRFGQNTDNNSFFDGVRQVHLSQPIENIASSVAPLPAPRRLTPEQIRRALYLRWLEKKRIELIKPKKMFFV